MSMSRCKMVKQLAVCLVLFILLDLCLIVYGKTFEFPRYSYRKKPKMERRYKSERNRCEKTEECSNVPAGITRTRCVRTCMSQRCYKELYAFDELEDGEIDVRLNSFKGCWAQEYNAMERGL